MEHKTLNVLMARPDANSGSETFDFCSKYYKLLEELEVGEQIRVGKFTDEPDLLGFASMMLKPDFQQTKGDGRNYEYTVNEKFLIYKVKRIR